MSQPPLDSFITDVSRLVRRTSEEIQLTRRVADRLSGLLASNYRLPTEFTRPASERHLNYPLHLAADRSWSLACVVWNTGQRTPVHSHETWGVAGIYSGVEREVRYRKPASDEAGEPLTELGQQEWVRGQVTVCCTADDDVHAVTAVGDEPTIGIHVYGADLGTLKRRSYDPATGAVQWFASGWDTPPAGARGVH